MKLLALYLSVLLMAVARRRIVKTYEPYRLRYADGRHRPGANRKRPVFDWTTTPGGAPILGLVDWVPCP
jgi:hypothetical protein